MHDSLAFFLSRDRSNVDQLIRRRDHAPMTKGVLAIWNDCAQGHRTSFESWYMREHLPERLSLPGFRHGRRYEVIGPGPEFFTYYDTDTPEVMATADYLARIEQPTPLTRYIMTSAFLNMNRTVCQVAHRQGRARGSVAAVLRLLDPFDPAHLIATVTELFGDPGLARAEVWIADQSGPAALSTEAKLRGGDETIAGCLFVDALHEDDAVKALDHLAARHTGVPGLYRLLCALDK